MRVFHDSRDTVYRSPFGVAEAGAPVVLRLDVWDAPQARAQVRTWVDGVGEQLYDMEPADGAKEAGATEDGPGDAPLRLEATVTPDEAGIVWYHFIVTDGHGNEKRYGARANCPGGQGELYDWEPPSFKMTVVDAAACEQARVAESVSSFDDVAVIQELDRAVGRPFREVALDLARNGANAREIADLLETVRENCTAATYRCTFELSDLLGLLGCFDCSFGGGVPACHAANDDVLEFWTADDGGDICLAVNLSTARPHDVLVPMKGEEVSELVGGYGVEVVEASEADVDDSARAEAKRYARVHVGPAGFSILHFHAEQRMQVPMEAGLGVLAHITSLPEVGRPSSGKRRPKSSPASAKGMGTGTLGAPARAFVDWLAEAGVRYWQVLPVNPTDEYGSPYAGISAFAGNIRLLEGGFAAVDEMFAESDAPEGYAEFCEREADWLEPHAAFMAIRRKVGPGVVWQDWPSRYRTYDPAAIAEDAELSAQAEWWRRAQFAFECQWRDLLEYAHERDVQIIGDMPIYVSADSSDVWANPGIFQLDSNGLPTSVAGCPPDSFAVDGQVWGNPLYDWDALDASGYAWWLRRLERAFGLYDFVRLDHFIGFGRYFSIPALGDAASGSYRPGPGMRLFRKAFEKFGPLPLIAEDLGYITPGIRELSAACGFPGMDIVQFVDGGDPLSGYWPRPEKIAYTGTHDNQTLVGYCAERYAHMDARQAARDIAEKVATCAADVCVFPLQDVLGLDDDARMNVPGTAKGNWAWQAREDEVSQALEYARELVALHEMER